MIIKGSRVIDPAGGTDMVRDILIRDGRIAALSEGPGDRRVEEMAGSGEEEISGSGLVAMPGLVDVHVHFRDPGLTYKEDIETGAMAAKAGGFTTVVCMANTKPVVDTPDTLRYVLEKGKATGIHVLSCVTLTRGMKGEKLTDLEALAEAGAAGFTDDGVPVRNGALLMEGLVRAGRLGLPVSLHEEDPLFIANNGINRGAVSEKLGIGGSPAAAEYSMTARDAAISAGIACRLNIQHVSAKRTVEVIRAAKAAGWPVYAEVTPHHFTLTEDAVLEWGSLAKMNPPLRTEEDRMALIEGLRDGTIDIIATDHAPHSAEEKARPLLQAPSGIIGLETALALGVTELCGKGYLTYLDLAKKMSLAPARLYGLDAGYIGEGGPADLVLFDDRESFRMNRFLSRASNSPFTGRELRGKVMYTVCGGKVVYEAGTAGSSM